ncbi:PadR family transcriptional regulator [Bacillus pumilus]|nr:PadR family transcriptional regulator [Bacillus pumilus]
MKQLIDKSLRHFWKISYGQIYPLYSLQSKKVLLRFHLLLTCGRSDKREYHLTEKGLDTLRQWLALPLDQLPAERNEVFLK